MSFSWQIKLWRGEPVQVIGPPILPQCGEGVWGAWQRQWSADRVDPSGERGSCRRTSVCLPDPHPIRARGSLVWSPASSARGGPGGTRQSPPTIQAVRVTIEGQSRIERVNPHPGGQADVLEANTRSRSPMNSRNNRIDRENSIKPLWSLTTTPVPPHHLENQGASRGITVDSRAPVHPQRQFSRS